MVSTATPAVRANCSIRYSMSTYSNNRRGAGRPRLARGVPVVHAVEPLRVGAERAGEEIDRVRVVVVVVVVNDRIAHVGRRAEVLWRRVGHRPSGRCRTRDQSLTQSTIQDRIVGRLEVGSLG